MVRRALAELLSFIRAASGVMNMQNGSMEKRHPIKVVVRRTGLSADVLRVWEKRYGVVRPGRSEGGHRLYSDADVERLHLLNRVTSAGRRISQMAQLTNDELMKLASEDANALFVARDAEAAPIRPEPHLAASISAVERLDARDLETSLMRATVALPAPVLIEEVVGPLLERIGDRWEHGRITPGHEHLASAVIRRVLESVINACAPGRDAPGLVVATPTGQLHEFGALLVAAAAAAMGWRVTHLGTSLPARDIADVARSTGTNIIALSIVYPRDDPELPAELQSLRETAGSDTEILVGGRAAPDYGTAIEAAGATLVTGLPQLMRYLHGRSPSGQPAA
jgi:DNA-binding transcriptional MerR regulator/methylmalonyl-CoA mutase cobalamin-binding subunit